VAWRRAIPAAAAALILGGCGGGHHSAPAKPSGSPAGRGAATAAPLPPEQQRAVADAQKAIAAYCAKAAKSLDSPQQALPSDATEAAVQRGVSTLIAVGRAHPAAMQDVLFAAESKLGSGCYPSLGNRIDAVRKTLR
jgi:hypothetical protein